MTGRDRADEAGEPEEEPTSHIDSAAYERDEGLAAERTELAWGRSTLSLLVCGVAIGRGLPAASDLGAHPLVGIGVLAVGGVAWLAGLPYARARAKASHTGVRHVATPGELAPLALGTALVGVAALLVDLLLPR